MADDLWDVDELNALTHRAAAERERQLVTPETFALQWARSRGRTRRRYASARRRTRKQRRDDAMAAIDYGLRPERSRDVIDAVRCGILTVGEARTYFGVDVPAQGASLRIAEAALAADTRKNTTPYVIRALRGVCWRYAVIGAVFIAAFGLAVAPSPLAVFVFAAAGVILGLWHRYRHGLGPLWRTTALAGATAYLAPSFTFFPYALVGVLGISALSPWWSERRPRG